MDSCYELADALYVCTAGRDVRLIALEDLPPSLRIAHHRKLLLAAVALAVAHGKGASEIAAAIPSFHRIPHRMEPGGQRDGVSQE